jgi:hypothetical protein
MIKSYAGGSGSPSYCLCPMVRLSLELVLWLSLVVILRQRDVNFFFSSSKTSLIFCLVLWRACNLTSFSPCITGPVDYLFASRHKGPRFKSPGEYLCETGILLLALSRYIGDADMIDHHGLVWGGLRPEP